MRAMPVGVWCAWRTPWALGDLATLTARCRAGGGFAAGRDARCAVRSAQRMLALLARLPGGWWRTTCLYRSVAECLALRAMGVEARIAISVSQEFVRESTQELVTGPRVVAHAWVEDATGATLGSAAANRDMTPLRPTGATA